MNITETDEVDGRAEEIMKPLVKLHFLKILLIDIGISLGDVGTDIAQGMNLIFDSEWEIQWTTFPYGLIVLGLVWLPGIPIFIHIVSFKSFEYFGVSQESRLLKVLSFFLFIPFIPTLMYVKMLLMKNRLKSSKEKQYFHNFEKMTKELKSLTGATESTAQFIFLLWLMLRGILSLPWDQPLSSSCVQDSLGRVACLPSIPMASMLFSILSILKSVFDLNTFPVVSSPFHSMTRTKLSIHVAFGYFPFYLGNIIFRMTSYAFILTYIDYWSIIPAVILYILNLALCGLFFIQNQNQRDESKLHIENEIRFCKSFNFNVNDGFVDINPSLSYAGHNMDHSDHCRKTFGAEGKYVKKDDDINSVDKYHHIDEHNTPIFINSIANFFFPAVYTLFKEPCANISWADFDSFLALRNTVIRYQVLLFNTSIIIIICVIFVYITFVPPFNYKTNILSFIWFSLTIGFLIFMGASTLVWAIWVYPKYIFSLRRYESNNREKASQDKLPGNFLFKGIYCLVLSSLVVLPLVIGILLFNFMPDEKFLVITVDEAPNLVLGKVVTALDSFNLNNLDVFIGTYEDNCNTNTAQMLVVNSSDCEAHPDFFIDFDDSLEEAWRVSSPRVYPMKHLEIPSVSIRKKDWMFLQEGNEQELTKTVLVMKQMKDWLDEVENLVQCSNDPELYINFFNNSNFSLSDRNKKTLLDNGSVVESRNFQITCPQDKHPCDKVDGKEKSLRIQCKSQRISKIELYVVEEEDSLKLLTVSSLQLGHKPPTDYCCRNRSHVLQFYGDECAGYNSYRNLLNHNNMCNFSIYFREDFCQFGIQQFSQFCKLGSIRCVVKQFFRAASCQEEFPVIQSCPVQQYPC